MPWMEWPCADRMLQVRWVEGRTACIEVACGIHLCDEEKAAGAFLHPRYGVGFHPTGRQRYIGCLYQGETILNPLPLPSALRIKLQGTVFMFMMNMI